ncbi:MAG TPA: chalcone isomerase family protein, partial [Thermoanaerobaculia bacterium]|nr:chalcone isomerase family protein [Thermoanaerobaculia bacterium]
ATELISSNQVKQVRMVMMRDLKKGQIAEAIEEGFEKNNQAQMPALRQRLTQFIAQLPDLESGETLVITYIPGRGTTVSSTSGGRMTVAGKDFADAMFSVWLGESPVDNRLKNGLLGG